MKGKKNIKVWKVSWDNIFSRLEPIDQAGKKVYGIPKGGMIASAFLKHAKVVPFPDDADLILDDVIETGTTMDKYKDVFPDKEWYALFNKPLENIQQWLLFPWEAQHPAAGDQSIQDSVTRILQYLGEDTKREGLVDTPRRVVKSWGELYSGYNEEPKEYMTLFDAEGYDELVLLKDIEFYSTCEHHMLPISGKAHVAYIPNKKLVGISKLARIVDTYSRRLQNQERITKNVVECVEEYLEPLGSACIIEAKHMCISCRGANKQESAMITSSVKGRLKNDSAKQELMKLIGL